ncbi:site-specific integrase [Sphaerisporangium siamense]|uniref:Integrase n=1 Tax=Sphaerisporangium siamense TaxID=795645 RepID=A0A7W7D2W7_9ACTN|nr:site-specific integrase [Sphaerisporangium siamense]MBB4699329.1 integrase [Sphaerisporangium siamense]GII89238.1 site-specific integrase [Sphaerisporangium siamense]
MTTSNRTRKDNGEGTIYQSASGKWHGRVTMGTKLDGTPDRRHVERKTKEEVEKAVKALIKKRDAGLAGRAGRVQTVEKFGIYWLDTILPVADRAPRTIADYRSKCENWVFKYIGKVRLDKVGPDHLENLYAEMRKDGQAPGHIRKVHAVISSMYSSAVRRGVVAQNPAKLVEVPAAGDPEKDTLTRDEARKILSETQKRRNAARWSVGLATGTRQGETLGLRWQYLDLDTGVAKIWYQLQRLTWQHGCANPHACGMAHHRGACPKDCGAHRHRPDCARGCYRTGHVCPKPCPKGCTAHAKACPSRKGGGLVFRQIKEKRRKNIHLAPELVAILRRHKEAQDFERIVAGDEWTDHDLVFCQSNGQPIDPRVDWEEWADIVKEAGLRHHKLHAQRHTAATLALEAGIALAVVQEMLGHSDIRVTRGYSHVASPLAQDAAQKMGRALWGK